MKLINNKLIRSQIQQEIISNKHLKALQIYILILLILVIQGIIREDKDFVQIAISSVNVILHVIKIIKGNIMAIINVKMESNYLLNSCNILQLILRKGIIKIIKTLSTKIFKIERKDFLLNSFQPLSLVKTQTRVLFK